MTDYKKDFLRFSLIPNSKRPSIEWSANNKNFRVCDLKHAGIPTGKINNITVIDLDFYKVAEDKNEFISKFKNYIDDFNTYTVQTCSGGIHLYFKYDTDITTTTNKEYNIDVRSNGGYVVSPGSVIDGKKYKVIKNTTIKEIPTDIKLWLLQNIYIKFKKEHTNYEKPKAIAETVFKYNVTESELIEIINNLDESWWSNDNYKFLKYTSFCKYFNIQKIWDDMNQKHDGYDYESNIKNYWDYAIPTNSIIDEILGDINMNYMKYKALPPNTTKPDKIINKKKLGYTIFKNKYNYIVKSDTGTGKTTSFKHYIKQHNLKFISIVSRISLGDEQYNTFHDHGIDCVNYHLADQLKPGDNIIITVDSIRRLYDFDLSEYVIFLDEYNSLLEYLITSTTLGSSRTIIYSRFISIIKKSKQIIATDADINDISYNFISNYIKLKYIVNEHKHNKDVNAYEIKSYDEMLEKLKTEDKFMLCTDSKSSAEVAYKYLDDKDILLIVSGNNKYYNLDDYDKVIFSPKIMYGLDSSMKRNIYCYYKEHTITPTGYLQQISRCRNINELYYCFNVKTFKYNDMDLNDIIDQTYNKNILGSRYFEDEVKTADYDIYIDTLNKYLYNNNCYDTNKFSYFRKLLTDRGINIKEFIKYKAISPKQGLIVKEIKQDKHDNFDITKHSSIQHILKIPDDKINDHIDLFIDQYKLQQHFNISSLLFNDVNEIKFKLSERNEFNVNKITVCKSKIIFIKKLQSYMNDSKITDFNVTKDISSGDRKTLFKEYNTIFRNRDTKKTFDVDAEISQYLCKSYKSLFGSKYVNTERKRTLLDGVSSETYTYTINNEEKDKHITIFNYRNSPIGRLI